MYEEISQYTLLLHVWYCQFGPMMHVCGMGKETYELKNVTKSEVEEDFFKGT